MWSLQSCGLYLIFAVWAQKVPPADLINTFNDYDNINNTNENLIQSTIDAPQIIYAMEGLKDGVCKNDLGKYIQAISKQEKWAMTMFDASVKFPNGLLYGQMHHMGNYDECINENDDNFKTQYCLAHVLVQNNSFVYTTNYKRLERNSVNKTIHWAFCLPKSCSHDEIEIILQTLFTNILNMEGLNVAGLSCTKNDPVPLNNLEILYTTAFGIFMCFIFLATGYHGLHIYKKTYITQYSLDRSRRGYSVWHEAILAFSLIRNVAKIIEIKAKNNDFNLDSICGLKAISMILILCGHALIFLITSPTVNSNFIEQEIYKPQYSVFLNSTLFVDSFLLISGFLMCRLLLLEFEKRNGKVNFLILYIARYIRLTPAYLAVIGFYMTYLIRLGDGPLWNDTISLERDRCLNSWWSNILYVNNYLNTDNFCMFQSWYLSVDTQLFIIAPFIIYPLWKNRIIGQWLICISAFFTALTSFLCTYFYNLDPTFMIYLPELKDLAKNSYFMNAYIKTHMRANTYILGILVGYLVHRTQSTGYKLSNCTRVIGWTFSSICGLSSLYSVIFFYSTEYEYSRINAAIFSPLHRICWCILVGWTIFITVVQNDGFINKILSWKLWGPFSRLTYCAYLGNGIIELYAYGTQKVPKYMSVFNMASETISQVILTFALAFVLCLLFESPIHNIEKILLKRDSSKKQQQQSGFQSNS